MDHVLVVLAAPLHVAHVPPQGSQKGLNATASRGGELGAHAGLFIVGPLILVQVGLAAFDQFQDLGGVISFSLGGGYVAISRC